MLPARLRMGSARSSARPARGSLQVAPLLSRGRHRGPRGGACLMEYVSWLAGERWSDHPGCVDSVLAALARSVNDRVGDEARQQLVRLAPEFIGTAGIPDDLRCEITIDVLLAALPVADGHDGWSTALALLAVARVSNSPVLRRRVEAALDARDGGHRDAARFLHRVAPRPEDVLNSGLPAQISAAVAAIARAGRPDRDQLLVGLLRDSLRRTAGCRQTAVAEPDRGIALRGEVL